MRWATCTIGRGDDEDDVLEGVFQDNVVQNDLKGGGEVHLAEDQMSVICLCSENGMSRINLFFVSMM